MKTTILCGILIAVVLLSGCTDSTSTTSGDDSLLPTPAELGSGFTYLYDIGPKTENDNFGNCPTTHTAVYEKGTERYSITVRECKDEASAKNMLSLHKGNEDSWTDSHLSVGDEAYEKVFPTGIDLIFAKGKYFVLISDGAAGDLFTHIVRTTESKL